MRSIHALRRRAEELAERVRSLPCKPRLCLCLVPPSAWPCPVLVNGKLARPRRGEGVQEFLGRILERHLPNRRAVHVVTVQPFESKES